MSAYFNCSRCGSTRDANTIYNCPSCGTVFCQSCATGEYDNQCPSCRADGWSIGIIDADRASRGR